MAARHEQGHYYGNNLTYNNVTSANITLGTWGRKGVMSEIIFHITLLGSMKIILETKWTNSRLVILWESWPFFARIVKWSAFHCSGLHSLAPHLFDTTFYFFFSSLPPSCKKHIRKEGKEEKEGRKTHIISVKKKSLNCR